MGEVSIFGNMPMTDTEALMKNLDDTKDDGATAGDVSYMSFSGKRGRYKIGVDGREPGDGEPFLVAIPAFEIGYIGWKGGKPIGKRMATISQPRVQAPPHDEGGPFDENKGEGWFKARAIVAKSIDNGEQIYFSNTSKSGVAAMADLQREVVDRMKSGQPCWPIVTLGMEEFEAQGFKNYKPVFNVVQWVSTAQVEALSDPDVDPASLLEDSNTDDDAPKVAPTPRKRRL